MKGLDESWTVYILECSDGTLYCGKTTDLAKRLEQHNSGGGKAAKYTRGRLPVKLVYWEKMMNNSLASKRELAIKRLSRKQKEMLINKGGGDDLFTIPALDK